MKRRRSGVAGSGAVEMIVMVGILGLGMMAAFIAAGTRLHEDYRAGKTTLTSPYP